MDKQSADILRRRPQERKAMSRTVIVPNSLRDAIYAKVDEAITQSPEAAADREYFYQQLLSYFDEHGSIPDFTLEKR